MKYHAKIVCVYIGEMSRTLETRLREHKYAVKKMELQSMPGPTNTRWAGMQPRQLEGKYWRRVLEVLHIHWQQSKSY